MGRRGERLVEREVPPGGPGTPPGSTGGPSRSGSTSRPAGPSPGGVARAARPDGRTFARGAGVRVGDALGPYLHTEAADFLRALRVHRESAGSAEAATEAATAVRLLRGSARRLSGTLHVYRPLLDTTWADQLRAELRWLCGTLAQEYAYATRLDRLSAALHRLASDGGCRTAPAGRGSSTNRGNSLPTGAARAGALLERQLTRSRNQAHSAALEALGSARCHAVADAVAVLASEVPLVPDSDQLPAAEVLPPLAEPAYQRLVDAIDALPLARAEHPFHAEALTRSLAAETPEDSAWHRVRRLLRRYRYAREVLSGAGPIAAVPMDDGHVGTSHGDAGPGGDVHGYAEERLTAASRALDQHRDAAAAAAAASAAARTARIAPATAYALGVLHADQRHEVEAARFAFGRLWAGDRSDGRTGGAG